MLLLFATLSWQLLVLLLATAAFDPNEAMGSSIIFGSPSPSRLRPTPSTESRSSTAGGAWLVQPSPPPGGSVTSVLEGLGFNGNDDDDDADPSSFVTTAVTLGAASSMLEDVDGSVSGMEYTAKGSCLLSLGCCNSESILSYIHPLLSGESVFTYFSEYVFCVPVA
jgi:hypothetical protein